ncbi:helix-turn-helix transcriptional regulator [Chloroflexia bacterium SDU3-3]|nr:helix-turn-helix transcriptional regulator [Chloroflexia bacterium SDU3-3]
MPIRSRVKVLLAERNLDRTRSGEELISVRRLSRETGITHSALVKLVNNQSERVDFETLDKLMRFFETTDIRDILEYTPAE